jgi:hypothetical protein
VAGRTFSAREATVMELHPKRSGLRVTAVILVTLEMTPSTSYTIERWNTCTGDLIGSQSQQNDSSGHLAIAVSNLVDDFAIRVQKPVQAPAAPTGVRIIKSHRALERLRRHRISG